MQHFHVFNNTEVGRAAAVLFLQACEKTSEIDSARISPEPVPALLKAANAACDSAGRLEEARHAIRWMSKEYKVTGGEIERLNEDFKNLPAEESADGG